MPLLSISSPPSLVRRAFKLAEVKHSEIFVDLGCGEGNVIFEMSKMGCFSIGVEINPYLCKIASLRLRENGLLGEVIMADINHLPLRKADVFYMYLWPSICRSILKEVMNASEEGTRIIVIDCSIPELDLNKVDFIRVNGVIRIICVYKCLESALNEKEDITNKTRSLGQS